MRRGRTGPDADPDKAGVLLQHVLLPESAITTDPGLYFRSSAPEKLRLGDSGLHLAARADLSFDSYFNLFSLGKWRVLCGLKTLALWLTGQGLVQVQVVYAAPGSIARTLWAGEVDLADEVTLPLLPPEGDDWPETGVIYFTLRSHSGPAVVQDAGFVTQDTAQRAPRLALSITTFRREAAVRATALRIAQFLRTSEFGNRMHLFVVDNGQSADLPASPQISHVMNPNLGGAGGFARGLLEATAQGFTHVLFMDDDAAIHMEAIHRTYMMLAYAVDPALAIAGAMINTQDPWQIWENGAVFDGKCRPQFSGVDLRNAAEVHAMECAPPPPAPWDDMLYGGWWFFAFPVAAVRHYPFPFFVRGDDVNFSLANPFRIVTLNGVVSQAEDFIAKETPLNWYLDLRSHMVHHLTVPKMQKTRIGVAKIAVWFFLRNLVRFQYETIEATLLAWNDVMRGPQFFAEHADMAVRRAQVAALTRQEAWKPVAQFDLSERQGFSAAKGWKRHLFRATGNGHLLPFFARWGNRVVVPADARGSYGRIWGAARITYLNASGDRAYQVRHSMLRFLGVSLRLTWAMIRFMWLYSSLLTAYRRAYPDLTSASFWQQRLGLDDSREEASDHA